MRVINKKGQVLGVPFQMIFSVILIAFFIFSAIYAIRYFIQVTENAQINKFIDNLRNEVNTVWLTDETTITKEFSLPTRISYVCFANTNTLKVAAMKSIEINDCKSFAAYVPGFENMNMFFCPVEKVYEIGAPIDAKIDCNGKECLSFTKSPYCIKNNGKVMINFEKTLGANKINIK